MSKNDSKIDVIRDLFPIFKQKVHGHDFVYLDSASTAQVPLTVLNEMYVYYTQYKANIGRGVYLFAERTTQAYMQARADCASFIGAKASDIIFVNNATEGINLVAQSWAANYLQKGDEILISEVEHHSNMVVWQELAARYHFKLTYVTVDQMGIVTQQALAKVMTPKTRLVSLFHTSNVLGSTNDIAALAKIVHQSNAVLLVDASQSVAHQPIDVQKLQADFLVFSGHKLFGPTGTGVLYVRPGLQGQMKPLRFGGGMVYQASYDKADYKPFPELFDAGTPNIAGAIGLAAAVRFMKDFVDFKWLQKHETMLINRFLSVVQQMPDIQIISPIQNLQHQHLVTFIHRRYHAHDVAMMLDQQGIAVRAGNHCLQPYHEACDLLATVRVSCSIYTTVEDIDRCIIALQKLSDSGL